MWEELSTEFKVLLVASEILVSLLAVWGLYKFFNKFKENEAKHKEKMKEWKKEV